MFAGLSRLRRRYGTLGPFLLLLSTLTIFFALIVLFTIWRWGLNSPTQTYPLYSRIALWNRTTSAITLLAALLRTAVTYQLALTTAMLASLIFASPALTLRDAAKMSIYRFSPPSPQYLAPPLLDMRGRAQYRLLASVALVCAIAFVTQLFSTLLVGSTGPGMTFAAPARVAIPMYGGNTTALPPPSYGPRWPGPVHLPTFAEAHSPGVKAAGVADTGPTMRAYFPLESEQRTALVSYSGVVQLQQLRTVCTTPKFDGMRIEADAEFLQSRDTFPIDEPPQAAMQEVYGTDFTLAANISAPQLPAALLADLLGVDTPTAPGPLLSARCRPPVTVLSGPTALFLCWLHWGPSQPFANTTLCGLGVSGCGIEWYLVVRQYTLSTPPQSLSPSALASLYSPSSWTAADSTGLTKSTATHNVSASLCAISNHGRRALADVAARLNVSEPAPISRLDAPGFQFNGLLEQLDTSLPADSRGIFSLRADRIRYFDSEPWTPTWSFATWRSEAVDLLGSADLYEALYEGVLRRRGVAAALQGCFGLMHADWVYTQMADYADRSDRATAEFMAAVIVPRGWAGLLAVLGVVIVHWIVLSVVAGVWRGKGGTGAGGMGSWRAIGEVWRGQGREVVETCGMRGDGEVGAIDGVRQRWNRPLRDGTAGAVRMGAVGGGEGLERISLMESERGGKR
ncbi:hypothetical protein EDC01DRAFT_776039 [Geopyxis carbonaria]|nr:hypothetical protein EDC01DRAFT_776039 [Geopyxis carbonaria]